MSEVNITDVYNDHYEIDFTSVVVGYEIDHYVDDISLTTLTLIDGDNQTHVKSSVLSESIEDYALELAHEHHKEERMWG